MNHKKKKEDAVLKVARELFNRPIRTVVESRYISEEGFYCFFNLPTVPYTTGHSPPVG